jgi:hypothetical protein
MHNKKILAAIMSVILTTGIVFGVVFISGGNNENYTPVPIPDEPEYGKPYLPDPENLEYTVTGYNGEEYVGHSIDPLP